MHLATLSRWSLGTCLALALLLLVVGWHSYERWITHREQLAELIDINAQADVFYDASEEMLFTEASIADWGRFEARADDLKDRIEAFESVDPAARKAAAIVDRVRSLVISTVPAVGEGSELHHEAADVEGDLARPPPRYDRVERLSGLDRSLEHTLQELLHNRREAIEADVAWLASSFGLAGTALALVSLGFLTTIHHRVIEPVARMRSSVDRIRAGDSQVRMIIQRSDELGMLAATINELLDQQLADARRLREQHELLAWRERMLSDSQRIAGIGSWQLEIATGNLQWSDETFRLLGEKPQSFAPTLRSFLAYVHPDDRGRLEQHELEATRGLHGHDIAFRIVRSDGAVRHVDQRAELEYGDDGEALYLTGTIQDVTELHEANEQLNQYKILVEGSDELFDIVDSAYRYVLVNEAYAHWHGYPVDALEGAHLADVLGEGYFETQVRPAIDRCLAGEPQFAEITRTGWDGKERHLLARYYPIDSPSGGERYKAGIITDITALKETQARLQEQSHLLAIAGRVARIGGWVLDVEDGRVTWSDIVADILEQPRGASRTIDESMRLVDPADDEHVRRLVQRCIDYGEPYDTEVRIVRSDGGEGWLRAAGEPVYGDDARVVRVQGALQDITQSKLAERRVERLAERLTNIVESITDAMCVVDRDWQFTFVNTEAERLLQRDRSELIGRNCWAEFPGGVGTRIETEFRRAVETGQTAAFETHYEPLGKTFDVRAYPSAEGLTVFFRDVTEYHDLVSRLEATEAELRRSRDALASELETRQALIDGLPANIAFLDSEGTIHHVNERWRAFARENEDADPNFEVGANYIAVCQRADGPCAEEAPEAAACIRALIAGERDHCAIEYPCHSPSQQRWFRLEATRLSTNPGQGRGYGVVAMHVDITERMQAERELRRLAYEDPLTRLPSRNGFVHAVSEWLTCRGMQPRSSVVAIDIERLRDINDTHGYAAGDALLVEAGNRLRTAVGEGGVVGRIGGDEFAVFLAQSNEMSPSEQRAAVQGIFDQPFMTDTVAVDLGARFGYTELGKSAAKTEELLREAELALFHNRDAATPDPWTAYSDELDDATRHRIEITRELRRALVQHEFELHFQPKVELATGRLLACEALIRWDHPERGLQSPGTFIPVAEQSQLIGPIGDWAIREACRRIHEWREAGLDVVPVAVNVSLVQFMVGDFTTTIRDALDAYDVPAWALSLEITESVFEQASTALRRQLEAIHDLGVRLSLDDFGTGYSSLLYLQRYPFDEIKIDQGFVFQMLDDPYSHQVVTLVMGLAEALGVDIIAEGVENPETRDALLALGCRRGQGYYYSMPLAPEDFQWLLEKRSPLPLGGVRPTRGATG